MENGMYELTNEELNQIDGGRSLWYEVGYGLGYAYGKLMELDRYLGEDFL
jgi:bacteriocin-like protein